MKFIILTNNPYVKEKLEADTRVEYMDITLEEVLLKTREMVHLGHKLLTHPLSGSVKPYETPYKSVMVSEKINHVDMESLNIIEQSLKSCEKFRDMKRKYSEETHMDLQLIDFTLISSAVPSADAMLG